MEPKGSLKCLQGPFTGPYPEPDRSSPYPNLSLSESYFNIGVVSPTPNPQAGGPPLVGCQPLLIQLLFAITLQVWRPSPLSAT
jgi:hypothetical protein